MHCVTRWSRFDNRFEGVLFTEVMKLVTPKPACRQAGRKRASRWCAEKTDTGQPAARRLDEAGDDLCLQA